MGRSGIILALIVLIFSGLMLLYPWYDVLWWSSLSVACSWSVILATYSKFSISSRIYPTIEADRKRFYELPPQTTISRQAESVTIPVGLQPIIAELCDLILRDFVESWFTELVKYKPEIFLTKVRDEMDCVGGALCQLLSSVEYLEFITKDIPDVLNDHIRQVQQASLSQGDLVQPFVLHECARDKAKEVAHLTVLSELLCNKLLPPHHDQLTRGLAVDALTKQVLQPMIDSVTYPDNVNQSLLAFLTGQEELATSYKRTFKYAASYEDFVELILKCSDIEELKQIRYHIITEIMFSTTLQGLKRTAEESDSSSIATNVVTRLKSMGKAEMLRSRDLKRYANQLRIAKAKCEKRITNLGGEEYAEYFADDQSSSQQRGHKVISFKLTMHSLACRGCFHAFLKADDSESLLEYWVAAETLKSCDHGDRHRLATEIYNKYVASSVSLVRLEKLVLKGMEAFLIGNRGPEAFYDAQEVVYRQLEDKYYPRFLCSNVYHDFIISWDGSESVVLGETTSYGSTEDYEDEEFQDVDDSDLDLQQTTSEYNKKKIADIDEKIYNKTQAHLVISGQRADSTPSVSKYASVLNDLEEELEVLKFQRRALEAHQEQVESWWRHAGLWNASLVQHEVVKEADGWVVYYLILIRLQDHQIASSPAHTNGWVVSRTLQQIRELHHDLCEIDKDISQLGLPSRVRLGKPSDEYIKKAKQQISNFLQSSELFNFVSSRPHLNTNSVRKRATFRVSKIFKRRQVAEDSDSADLLFYNQGDDGARELSRSKDSIAAPLYSLISEVFELKGAFKLLRKTLVQLVQVTYGKSINRQIRETVNWMVSETMLVYYLKYLRNFFWPGGKLAPPNTVSSKEEQLQTRIEARAALTRNIPEFVIRIFGDKSAKLGLTKVFDSFQDQTLNKHFAYVLLTRFTEMLFTELAEPKSEHEGDDFSVWSLPAADVDVTNQTASLDRQANQQSDLETFSDGASVDTYLVNQEPVAAEVTSQNASSAVLSGDSHIYRRYIPPK